MKLSCLFQKIYFNFTGYSFPNLGRLFLRMFVGLMLSQFGIRQLIDPQPLDLAGSIPFLECGLDTWLIIVVEIICSFFIMIGLFTRLMILPAFVLMICSCHHIVVTAGSLELVSVATMALPFMFMGVYMFMLVVGAGKISIDYFLSLYLISRNYNGKEDELEVV